MTTRYAMARAGHIKSRSHQVSGIHIRTYPLRIMTSLAVSLLLVTLCFKLPFGSPVHRVGWHLNGYPQQQPLIDLINIKPAENLSPMKGAPITMFGERAASEDGKDEKAKEEVIPEPSHLPTAQELSKLDLRDTILDFPEQQPRIAGGMSAFYINIMYPQAAIDAGIHGRLVLNFVVEKDGQPTNIEVMKTLHPLCDSAAVRALRRTKFIPGRQNGERVRVRMRLPVHFKLIAPNTALPADTTTTKALAPE